MGAVEIKKTVELWDFRAHAAAQIITHQSSHDIWEQAAKEQTEWSGLLADKLQSLTPSQQDTFWRHLQQRGTPK